jgi:putative transposase
MKEIKFSYLKRLEPKHYRAQACIHWSMTIQDRRTGWLVPIFYYKFRELLTHACFRYGLCSPIFCLMPDRMHLLWLGITDEADQKPAMKFLRGQVNQMLKKLGYELQDQSYDHVLRDDERQTDAYHNIVEYIARNPERKNLVPHDGFRSYPYTSCLMPGYPDLSPFQPDFWSLFDSLYSQLRKSGLQRHP